MEICEYLLSYGNAGDFGRFRPLHPLACRRGDRAVVQSHRGLELGVVLCPAQQGHARFLPNPTVGQLLRLANADDELAAERLSQQAQQVFQQARRVVAELGLPLEILDVELLLDARHALVHYLRWAECDPRPFLETLSDQYRLLVTLHDLALPAPELDALEQGHGSCDREDCGGGNGSSCSSGACSTCGIKNLIKTPPSADDGIRAQPN